VSRQVGSAHVEFSARTGKVVTGMEEAKRATRAAAREMKADIHEAKASMALLGEEVGIKLPRHLRSFVAELPGVASAMAAAFNGAAIIGLGMIAVEQAKKIYEFFHAISEMAEKAQEESANLHATLSATNDELIKTNDQLANTNAKFEGKKENTLAIRLDDAAIAAAKLAKALKGVEDEELRVMKTMDVGFFQQMMSGTGGTGDVTGAAKKFWKGVRDTAIDYQHEVEAARDAGDEKHANDLADEAKKNLTNSIGIEKAKAEATLAQARSVQDQLDKMSPAAKMLGRQQGIVAPEQDMIIEASKTHLNDLADAQRNVNELFRQGVLEGIKAGETGESAAERLKKAQQEAFQAMRVLIEQDIAARTASEHITDELTKTWVADEHKRQEEVKRSEQLDKERTAEFIKNRKDEQEQTAEFERDVRAAASEEYAGAQTDEAAKVQLAQETNAQRLANLHDDLDKREKATQESLQRERDQYAEFSKEWNRVNAEMQKDAAAAARESAAMQREALESGIGGAMLEMERKAMDTASTIREVFTSMVSGINDQLTNLMTGKRVTSRDWSNMFGGVASQAAHAGLSSAEGFAMKALNLGGKPDGSKGKPLYVKNVDDIKKAGAEIANLTKGSPDPSTASLGGLGGWLANKMSGGGFFGSLLSALIPHASGGPMIPGAAYLVGERGPEPFFPGVSGSMGTNAAMRRAFGGSGNVSHTVNVDASGSGDPAAVTAAVHRAMRSYLPTFVTASSAYQQDMKRRTPAISGGSF